MESIHKGTEYEMVVVKPIKNGYLIEIETPDETITIAAKSWRQVIACMKRIGAGAI